MYCGNCGKKVGENAIFCKYCGSSTIEENIIDKSATPKKKKTRKNELVIICLLLIVLVGVTFYAIQCTRKVEELKRREEETKENVSKYLSIIVAAENEEKEYYKLEAEFESMWREYLTNPDDVDYCVDFERVIDHFKQLCDIQEYIMVDLGCSCKEKEEIEELFNDINEWYNLAKEQINLNGSSYWREHGYELYEGYCHYDSYVSQFHEDIQTTAAVILLKDKEDYREYLSGRVGDEIISYFDRYLLSTDKNTIDTVHTAVVTASCDPDVLLGMNPGIPKEGTYTLEELRNADTLYSEELNAILGDIEIKLYSPGVEGCGAESIIIEASPYNEDYSTYVVYALGSEVEIKAGP